VKYEGYTEFENNRHAGHRNEDWKFEGYDLSKSIESIDEVPAFYVWNSLNWTDEDTYCGWKVLPGEQGHNTLSTVWETRWWHSVTPKPHKYVGGPFRASIADYTLGLYSLFFTQKFCPITDLRVTYDKSIRVGDPIECLVTNTIIENDILKQECIQRVYGSDVIVGRGWSSHYMKLKKVPLKKGVSGITDYKHKQQDMTELNGDGNRDRGRYGEDVS